MSDAILIDDSRRTSEDADARAALRDLLRASPLPDKELLENLGTYIPRQAFTRLLALSELYRMIVPLHGVAMEFGCRWGQTMALMATLRGMFEPYNYRRILYGFDTFEGLAGVSEADGAAAAAREGAYGVTADAPSHLNAVMTAHERLSPISHVKKYELIAGDASQTLPRLLEERPETIVAFAYFDMDIYKPTKDCLELVLAHATKGAVIGFDELVDPNFPGETRAYKEVLGTRAHTLRRFDYAPNISYIILD